MSKIVLHQGKMSKVTLIQCDMCHKRGEDLYTLKVKIPDIDFNRDDPGLFNQNLPDKVIYDTYDLCEDCIRKLRKFIERKT